MTDDPDPQKDLNVFQGSGPEEGGLRNSLLRGVETGLNHPLPEVTLDSELKFLTGLTRRFPRMRGAAFAASLLRRFYLRKRRTSLEVEALGFRMQLNPSEFVDGALLFNPHLYEHREIGFMRKHLRPGDVFLDIGAHIGFYSLIASRIVGEKGAVVAVEADPYNFKRLTLHLKSNRIQNVIAVNEGVSNKKEVLRLGLNVTGNRAGNSFLSMNEDHIDVPCSSLAMLLRKYGINRVHGAKFDIEGFEFRVLDQFFRDIDDSLRPDFMIVEQHAKLVERAGGNVIELLESEGYRTVRALRTNYLMMRRDSHKGN
jgi:FkbM family methyltransferase